MSAQNAKFGRYVFALGIVALALVSLAWGDFDSGQPVPKSFPDRTAVAYAAAAFVMLGLDSVWLTLTANSLYRPRIGELMLDGFRPAPASLAL